MLPLQRPPADDPLDGLRHVQPRAAQRGVQRHHPVGKQPGRRSTYSGDLRDCPKPESTAAVAMARVGRAPTRSPSPLPSGLGAVVGCLRQLGQDLEQLVLQPRMQHRIRRSGHALGPHLARGWTEQRQQLGRATADVLMRLAERLALGLPGLARLRDGLIRAGLILAPQRDAHRFGDAIGQVDQPLFSSVFGSTTVTTPALRLRWAVPGRTPRARPLVRAASVLEHPTQPPWGWQICHCPSIARQLAISSLTAQRW